MLFSKVSSRLCHKNKFAYYKYTYYICTDKPINHKNDKCIWTKSHSIVTKDVTKEQINAAAKL